MSAPRTGLSRVLTATFHGIEGRRVRVETDVAASLPGFSLVGLPSAALRESRERVGAALRNAGYRWPDGRITVSLAPADLRKDGAAMDLAIATSLLLASGQVRRPPDDRLRRTLFVGELALDGALRPARGTLALALDAAALGVDRLIVPGIESESLLDVMGVQVLALRHLRDLERVLLHGRPVRSERRRPPRAPRTTADDAARALGEVRGQERAKRALLVAAAGGHGLVMQGPPGCGKTMLARRLVGLLPDLEGDLLGTARRIRSCSGLADLDQARPPLRAPHHTVSAMGLIGGGRPLRAGEITLAHGGVLLLDEIAEFGTRTLERLREPLVDGRIELARAGERVVLPAGFQLVATGNPCPCGWAGSHLDRCRCAVHAIERYRRRLSGPLRDRIDLWVDMDREPAERLLEDGPVQVDVETVERVRAIRRSVSTDDPIARVDPDARAFLSRVADRSGLSARAVRRATVVASTIAALDGRDVLRRADLAEAFTYRDGQASPIRRRR